MGGVGLLADVISGIQKFVWVFVLVYGLVIFAYILMSWIRMPYSVWMSRIQKFLRDTCEPYMALFRRVLPPLGPLDLSPMLALVVLFLAGRLVVYILGRFH